MTQQSKYLRELAASFVLEADSQLKSLGDDMDRLELPREVVLQRLELALSILDLSERLKGWAEWYEK